MQASERVAAFSVAAKRFPNEPTEPLLKTAFPGPLSVASMEEYGAISCNKQQQFPVDLESSLGNYVADADGNMYLDVFTSIACIGMGYNHPTLLEASRSDLMKAVLVNRTGMQMNPP
jgi:4-aminobutyrate aminotransferase/(S)-3-amino-2-methylpropionate transaminase